MRIECTEGVVVNNIIGSFIKQQPTIEKLGVHFANIYHNLKLRTVIPRVLRSTTEKLIQTQSSG